MYKFHQPKQVLGCHLKFDLPNHRFGVSLISYLEKAHLSVTFDGARVEICLLAKNAPAKTGAFFIIADYSAFFFFFAITITTTAITTTAAAAAAMIMTVVISEPSASASASGAAVVSGALVFTSKV